MPELPEVEITRRGLWAGIRKRPQLQDLVFHRKDLRYPLPLQNGKKLLNHRVVQIERRGKYLIFVFDHDLFVISHLGMSGTWRVQQLQLQQSLHSEQTQQLLQTVQNSSQGRSQNRIGPHDHIEMIFEGLELIYNDPRRFGFFLLLDSRKKVEKYFENMGFEPLSSDWSADDLYKKIHSRQQNIKSALMDQKIIVGIGNIYACEILFRAGVSPWKRASRINQESLEKIILQTRVVLQEAIDRGGSSIQDFKNTAGHLGDFQKNFSVYGREGEACRKCGHKIRQRKNQGRSTFWCSKCQH